MSATLSSPGAKAATAKRRLALRAAMPRAAVPMSRMYGKTTRVSSTVRANSPGRSWYPAAKSSVSGRAKSIPATVTTTSATSDAPRTRAKKRFAASSPSRASFSERTGTTALVIAPSPSSDRSAFGMVKATHHASVASRSKSAASAMSRTRPSTRDASVPAPTTPARATSRLRSRLPSSAKRIRFGSIGSIRRPCRRPGGTAGTGRATAGTCSCRCRCCDRRTRSRRGRSLRRARGRRARAGRRGSRCAGSPRCGPGSRRRGRSRGARRAGRCPCGRRPSRSRWCARRAATGWRPA